MSSGVGFLLIAVVVSLVGSLIVWLRSRKPTHFMSSVDDFQREMDALSTPPAPSTPPRPVRNVQDADNRRLGGR
ncbi:MAG: hypothetical protein WEA11_02260 [Acidimicrobiales bacterium]